MAIDVICLSSYLTISPVSTTSVDWSCCLHLYKGRFKQLCLVIPLYQSACKCAIHSKFISICLFLILVIHIVVCILLFWGDSNPRFGYTPVSISLQIYPDHDYCISPHFFTIVMYQFFNICIKDDILIVSTSYYVDKSARYFWISFFPDVLFLTPYS